MPINGFSDRVRLERLGKIRLGVRVPTKADPNKTYPKATEFFVCPPEVAAVVGENPTKIAPIMFPTDNQDDWMSQYYRCYSLTYGLVCMGDGITANQRTDLATGCIVDRNTAEGNWVWREVDCEGEDCPMYQKRLCRPIMRLQFLIPEVPGLGVWELCTSSRNSRLNIQSTIHLVRSMAMGHIKMIPLTLSLEPQEVTPAGSTKKSIHVVHLKHALKMADFLRIAAQPIAEQFQLAKTIGQTPEAAAEEEPPEDLMPPYSEEEATAGTKSVKKDTKTPAGETQPAASDTKPAASDTKAGTGQSRPAFTDKQEKIKEIDVQRLVNDFWGAEGWEKVCVPMMKEMFGADTYENLMPDEAHKLWTALKAKDAKAHETNQAGAAATTAAPKTEAEMKAFVANMFGDTGWDTVCVPTMKDLFKVDSYGKLTVNDVDKLYIHLRDKVLHGSQKKPATKAPSKEKKKEDPAITTLRRKFQSVLMDDKNMTLEQCMDWIKTNLNGRTSTEGMSKEELEAAIAKATSGAGEAITRPLF